MAKNINFVNNNSVANITTNFNRVKAALQDVLGRSGETPNHMLADLDMNSNDILNVKVVDAESVLVNGVPVGQVPITYRGEWNASVSYIVNDIVRDDSGNLWIALDDNSGSVPVEGPDWTLFLPGSTVADNTITEQKLADGAVTGSKTDGSFGWAEFPSRVEVASYRPASAPESIRTRGYAVVGDGGEALYKRVGTQPSHEGKVSVTLRDNSVVWYEITHKTVNVLMFGATEADLYTGAQKALNYIEAKGGGTLVFPRGSYSLTTSLVSKAPNTTILLDDDCTINHNTPDFMALQIQGARTTVRGGINGGFVGPAAWDPVDGSGSLTYAVIRFTGEEGRVERTRIFNIRRVGIQFKDVNNGVVEGCVIDGNQPQPTYPLVLTNLHGIHLDVGTEASAGNYKVLGNTIRFVTQGVNLANFGGGGNGTFGNARGCVIANNIFYNMWDHGVYTNYADGITITGNNFNDCHTGVAASGPRHTITGNSFVALSSGGGEWHVSAVSLRDPQYCVVSDNVFFGTLTTNSPICIDLACFNTDVSYNVVANNTIRTVGRGVGVRITYRNIATCYVYDNIVEGNNIVSQGRASEGIIQIEGNPAASGIVNLGNIIRGNRLSVEGTADNAHGIGMQNIASSLIADNVTRMSYNATAAAASSGISLHNCTDVKTSGNLVVVPAGQGTNVTVTGLKETGSCLRNEARGNRSSLSTAATGFSYTEVQPASSASKLLADYEGTGVPSAALRTGSRYTRLDGGNLTSLYVNQGDGVNWAGK